MTEYGAWALREQEGYLRALEDFVARESPSTDKAACDRAAAYLEDLCRRRLGGRVVLHPRSAAGDHLEVTVGEGRRRILLLCHLDTVWPLGTLARLPFRVEGNRVSGPGVLDMKGGTLLAVWALSHLVQKGTLGDRTFTVLITSDEETGSATSRELIEERARHSAAVLVLEPAANPEGDVTLWRKGVGEFTVRVKGRAAHAGREPERGRSAVVEIAHQILDLAGLARPDQGTTVNVGVVRGGTRSNVVAAEAEAEVDFRVRTLAEAERLVAAVRNRPTFVEGVEVAVQGGLNRPPMEESEGSRRLYALAHRLAAEEGVALGWSGTGGASDGNLTAALGIPTLDGLGAVGGGAHAEDEHLRLDHLAPRMAWLSHVLELV